jgi:hypothetical protein
MKINKADLIHKAKLELARKSLWYFCAIMMPEFYSDEKKYLKELCDTIQAFYENKLGKNKLMINLPPRFGKSLTLMLFETWILGKDIKNKVITVSYNNDISNRFSKGVRNIIDETKLDDSLTIYTDIFPNVKIKKGDGAADIWSLEGTFFSYLGTGFGGTITGVGANMLIIDDPIKNASEALNRRVLDSHEDFYRNTFLSRLERGGKIILNHTRWAEEDICGKLLKAEPDEWFVFKRTVVNENDELLCETVVSRDEYNQKKSAISNMIFQANYMQTPVNFQNRLYTNGFKTYNTLNNKSLISCVVDTADSGTDLLTAIVYTVVNNLVYVLDILYTDSNMDITEQLLSEFIIRNQVNNCYIESNNGGRYFASNIDKRLNKKVMVDVL